MYVGTICNPQSEIPNPSPCPNHDPRQCAAGFPRLYAGPTSCSARPSPLCSPYLVQRRLTKAFYWREFEL